MTRLILLGAIISLAFHTGTPERGDEIGTHPAATSNDAHAAVVHPTERLRGEGLGREVAEDPVRRDPVPGLGVGAEGAAPDPPDRGPRER